jgi:hypothetical protein
MSSILYTSYTTSSYGCVLPSLALSSTPHNTPHQTHLFSASTAFPTTSLPKHITSTLHSFNSSNFPISPILLHQPESILHLKGVWFLYIWHGSTPRLELPHPTRDETDFGVSARAREATSSGSENGGFAGREGGWRDEECEFVFLGW